MWGRGLALGTSRNCVVGPTVRIRRSYLPWRQSGHGEGCRSVDGKYVKRTLTTTLVDEDDVVYGLSDPCSEHGRGEPVDERGRNPATVSATTIAP